MASTRKNKPESGQFVAYYRVSDIKQGLSGLGLEAQRSSVERYVAQVKGSLIGEFTEVESGKNHKNRPELLAAIQASKRASATLVIAKLDRLARNVHFISGLMESAADFVAVDMPSANKLTLHIMAAMAEHEREMISARTKAGLAVVQEEIKRMGFRVSKTGRRCDKLGNPRWEESIQAAQLARHPRKLAAHVAEIMESRRNAGIAFRHIAAELNTLGLRTPFDSVWYASTVRAALING